MVPVPRVRHGVEQGVRQAQAPAGKGHQMATYKVVLNRRWQRQGPAVVTEYNVDSWLKVQVLVQNYLTRTRKHGAVAVVYKDGELVYEVRKGKWVRDRPGAGMACYGRGRRGSGVVPRRDESRRRPDARTCGTRVYDGAGEGLAS